MSKPVVRIEHWQYHEKSDPFYKRDHVLTGSAYGHPSVFISEGEPITTSVIVGVNGGRVETRNTLYELGEWKGDGLTKNELFSKLSGTPPETQE